MHAATRAGSVLFAPPPCAKGTATVKFFTMDYNEQILQCNGKIFIFRYSERIFILKIPLTIRTIVLIKVWDIIDRNESDAKVREKIEPIAKKLITSQIGTSINQEIMDRHLVCGVNR